MVPTVVVAPAPVVIITASMGTVTIIMSVVCSVAVPVVLECVDPLMTASRTGGVGGPGWTCQRSSRQCH